MENRPNQTFINFYDFMTSIITMISRNDGFCVDALWSSMLVFTSDIIQSLNGNKLSSEMIQVLMQPITQLGLQSGKFSSCALSKPLTEADIKHHFSANFDDLKPVKIFLFHFCYFRSLLLL